jgi:hypothetical protein
MDAELIDEEVVQQRLLIEFTGGEPVKDRVALASEILDVVLQKRIRGHAWSFVRC